MQIVFDELFARCSKPLHIVVGPTVYVERPDDHRVTWYFMVAVETAPGAAEYMQALTDGDAAQCESIRDQLMAAAMLDHTATLVHDVGDELAMARLCEAMWPSDQITTMRKSVEAERRASAH